MRNNPTYLRFTDEENAFREEVRAFLKEKMPEDIRKRMVDGESMDKDDLVRWTRILAGPCRRLFAGRPMPDLQVPTMAGGRERGRLLTMLQQDPIQ